MRKIVLCLFSEKHFNFMTNFMTRLKACKIAGFWIDTRLLIKLRGGIKRNRVWMKKNFSKKFRNGETKSHRRRKKLTAAGKGEMVCWVCLICKVTLEVSWFDLWSRTEARWLKQLLQMLLLGPLQSPQLTNILAS